MTVTQKTISTQLIPQNPLLLMHRMYRYILPEVSAQLAHWRSTAERMPDEELRTQAINSMTSKRFHCQGGAVYATANMGKRNVLVPLIVALQTISDYLDNLCDRSTSMDGVDFRQLHQAMLDAVNPQSPIHDYYAYHSEKEDGGYLEQLVRTCQSCICMLPSYSVVQQHVTELVSLYSDLQVYKHIVKDQRENELHRWWDSHRDHYADLHWNEFAAATGSTLGMFMLFVLAAEPNLSQEDADIVRNAYFPYVCGLHILLDYLIDQQEDEEGGDLNFCSYYDTNELTVERIVFITKQAREAVQSLQASRFHRMIIEGLIALYLSDPKVKKQQAVSVVSKQLMRNSPWTRLFFWINSKWIRKRDR